MQKVFFRPHLWTTCLHVENVWHGSSTLLFNITGSRTPKHYHLTCLLEVSPAMEKQNFGLFCVLPLKCQWGLFCARNRLLSSDHAGNCVLYLIAKLLVQSNSLLINHCWHFHEEWLLWTNLPKVLSSGHLVARESKYVFLCDFVFVSVDLADDCNLITVPWKSYWKNKLSKFAHQSLSLIKL